MENPFNKLTTLSVVRPKATIASILIITLALASMAQFINFDNSEDAFYPQNDTTDLLYEIEDRYQASLDFISASCFQLVFKTLSVVMAKSRNWRDFLMLQFAMASSGRCMGSSAYSSL